MAIIERRTFYGRVGSAGELVEISKAFFAAIAKSGVNYPVRVLSDHQSGRTDRVVYEMEVPSIAAVEEMMQSLGENEELGAALGALEARLNKLITHAEVEHWQIAD